MEFIENLPTNGRNKYDWEEISAQLREHPQQWAHVNSGNTEGTPTAAQMLARKMRDGSRREFPFGEFDSTTRGNKVYARYVGPTHN